MVSEQTFLVSVTSGAADLASIGIGNADPGMDYDTGVVTNRLAFRPEQQSIRFPFRIFDDDVPEGTEAFRMTITTGKEQTFTVGTNASATVIIYDDECKFVEMSTLSHTGIIIL